MTFFSKILKKNIKQIYFTFERLNSFIIPKLFTYNSPYPHISTYTNLYSILRQ